MAAPLAVGVTSESELLDVWLRKWVPPQAAMMMARAQLPAGFSLLDVWEVPQGAPALQAMVRAARYECVAVHEAGIAAARQAAREFLQSESVVHRFVRGEEARSIDLRPFVHSISIEPRPDGSCNVAMKVSIGQEGGARPDHVLSALGFKLPATSIHRASLSFEEPGGDEDGDAVGWGWCVLTPARLRRGDCS